MDAPEDESDWKYFSSDRKMMSESVGTGLGMDFKAEPGLCALLKNTVFLIALEIRKIKTK